MLEFLQVSWYLVLCAAVVFYTVLDGFDLGVGILHLFIKGDNNRRLFLNAIGPVWDGNAVWLVITGGALFAGFPDAYAVIFSSFYSLLMVFLCGLIMRAVSIEFRSKVANTSWRYFWDVVFSLSSVTIAFGAGVLLGNMMLGIPINSDRIFEGTLIDFFSFFPILVGLLAIVTFAMQGVTYLYLKTEGELQKEISGWIMNLTILLAVVFTATSIAIFFYCPYLVTRVESFKIVALLPFLALLFITLIPYFVRKGKYAFAFVASSLNIILLFVLFGIGTFPTIVRSTINPENLSLTLFNSSSSETTLTVICLVALIGIPLILSYGFLLYKVFHGKVKLDKTSY